MALTPKIQYRGSNDTIQLYLRARILLGVRARGWVLPELERSRVTEPRSGLGLGCLVVDCSFKHCLPGSTHPSTTPPSPGEESDVFFPLPPPPGHVPPYVSARPRRRGGGGAGGAVRQARRLPAGTGVRLLCPGDVRRQGRGAGKRRRWQTVISLSANYAVQVIMITLGGGRADGLERSSRTPLHAHCTHTARTGTRRLSYKPLGF